MTKAEKPKASSEIPTGLGAMENVVMELPQIPKPPSPPVSPKSKISKLKVALMIIGGVILFLILITASVFWAARNQKLKRGATQIPPTPTPSPVTNPTTNRKTYIDSDYGFSINYPSNFVSNISDYKDYLRYITFTEKGRVSSDLFRVSVSSQPLDKQVDYEKFYAYFGDKEIALLANESEIVHKGFKGVRLDYVPKNEGAFKPTTIIVLNKEKYSYVLDIKTKNTDQILSTFEFLD